jgi:hypothetical protein
MKGGVLHKLGLKLVKWRIMKASFGLVAEPTFIEGQHPPELKYNYGHSRRQLEMSRCHEVVRHEGVFHPIC